MRVVVTGAAGFIGRRLVQALITKDRLRDTAGRERMITELLLLDRVSQSWPENAGGIAIRCETGDLNDADFRERVFSQPFDSLFHLAATLTTEAERDLEAGLRANVTGLLDLLAICRRQKARPKFIFASSIATFGGALPGVVEDNTVQKPQTSYGAHKAITELLLDDHTRHRVLDGRSLRLPIVLIRPGQPASSVSDRVAGIVREPLRGQDVACPLAPETWLPVVSVGAVAQGLVKLHELPVEAFTDSRALNLPALSVTVAAMVESLQRVAKGRKLGSIRWAPEAALQRIVDSWPKRFDSVRARRLGILPDADFDSILADFIASETASA